MTTVNELVNEALDRARRERDKSDLPEAKRDFALAITHLEDGLTRYNSGRYHDLGVWRRSDPDLTTPR